MDLLQAGFTLVEILVATTLLALLLGVLFATFYTSVRAWDRADEYGIGTNDIEAVQRFLRSRIAAANPVLHPQADVDRLLQGARITFIGETDRLSFVSPLPAHRATGGLHLFVLSIEDGGLQLFHRPFHPHMASLQPSDERPWNSLTLLERVTQLRFRYLGKPNDDTDFGWHETWLAATHTPVLVEMALERTDPNAVSWPLFAARTTIERRVRRGAAIHHGAGTALESR